MREMVREKHGLASEIVPNVAMRWGTQHENCAIIEYEEKKNDIVISSGFVQHPELDFLGGSPDGLLGDRGIVEIKCPYFKKSIQLDQEPQYQDQIQHLLAVTQREFCDFVVWTSINLTVETVKADKNWIENALPIFNEFIADYNMIICDKELTNPYLVDKYIDVKSSQWAALGEQYKAAKYAQDFAKKELDSIKENMIQKTTQEHSSANIKSDIFTLSSYKRAGTIKYRDIVAEKLPELDLEQYRSDPQPNGWTVRLRKSAS